LKSFRSSKKYTLFCSSCRMYSSNLRRSSSSSPDSRGLCSDSRMKDDVRSRSRSFYSLSRFISCPRVPPSWSPVYSLSISVWSLSIS
jgi:hypothetical protein